MFPSCLVRQLHLKLSVRIIDLGWLSVDILVNEFVLRATFSTDTRAGANTGRLCYRPDSSNVIPGLFCFVAVLRLGRSSTAVSYHVLHLRSVVALAMRAAESFKNSIPRLLRSPLGM